jgi:hypothetical protein
LLINNTAVPWLLPYFGVWRHVFYWFVYGLTAPSVALVTQRRTTERRLDGNSEVLKLKAAGSIKTLAPKYQTLLEDLWTIWSCCLYVFYEYYYHNPSYSLGSIFINAYLILFLFNNVIYVFYCYDYVFSLYVYVWLPWLRFFRAFSSAIRQMPG